MQFCILQLFGGIVKYVAELIFIGRENYEKQEILRFFKRGAEKVSER